MMKEHISTLFDCACFTKACATRLIVPIVFADAREMRERNKKRLQRRHAKTPIEEQDFTVNVKGGRLRTKSDYDVEMSKFKKNEDIIMEVMMEVDGDGEYHCRSSCLRN